MRDLERASNTIPQAIGTKLAICGANT